jgi:hypothetical protein
MFGDHRRRLRRGSRGSAITVGDYVGEVEARRPIMLSRRVPLDFLNENHIDNNSILIAHRTSAGQDHAGRIDPG